MRARRERTTRDENACEEGSGGQGDLDPLSAFADSGFMDPGVAGDAVGEIQWGKWRSPLL